jgi:hypothetical protein
MRQYRIWPRISAEVNITVALRWENSVKKKPSSKCPETLSANPMQNKSWIANRGTNGRRVWQNPLRKQNRLRHASPKTARIIRVSIFIVILLIILI